MKDVGIEREQLEKALTSESEKEILSIIDSVCPSAFITNRNRLELVKRIDDFVLQGKLNMPPRP